MFWKDLAPTFGITLSWLRSCRAFRRSMLNVERVSCCLRLQPPSSPPAVSMPSHPLHSPSLFSLIRRQHLTHPSGHPPLHRTSASVCTLGQSPSSVPTSTPHNDLQVSTSRWQYPPCTRPTLSAMLTSGCFRAPSRSRRQARSFAWTIVRDHYNECRISPADISVVQRCSTICMAFVSLPHGDYLPCRFLSDTFLFVPHPPNCPDVVDKVRNVCTMLRA